MTKITKLMIKDSDPSRDNSGSLVSDTVQVYTCNEDLVSIEDSTVQDMETTVSPSDLHC